MSENHTIAAKATLDTFNLEGIIDKMENISFSRFKVLELSVFEVRVRWSSHALSVRNYETRGILTFL